MLNVHNYHNNPYNVIDAPNYYVRHVMKISNRKPEVLKSSVRSANQPITSTQPITRSINPTGTSSLVVWIADMAAKLHWTIRNTRNILKSVSTNECPVLPQDVLSLHWNDTELITLESVSMLLRVVNTAISNSIGRVWHIMKYHVYLCV